MYAFPTPNGSSPSGVTSPWLSEVARCYPSSFAGHIYAQGFDTWTMEVRGGGLSTLAVYFKDINTTPTSNLLSEDLASHNVGQ
ncbi:hypothetical protein MLD38_034214 [Melastoma candidum]|uniref:Uncharacterized protein n=1 Tax=Melastoma candidum TaxID=119954 RepID=A0ACB9MBV4_9MYRT|nr:hypothetical protein MLD38_034214 [Melastoma candidum]